MVNKDLKPMTLLCILLAAAAAAGATGAAAQANNKMIRVALHKGTTMKAGIHGQPVTSYYARVDIGTPPKTFNLSIDIGARETWLPHYSMLGGILFNRLHYRRGYSKKSSSTSVKKNSVFTFEHMQCELEAKPYEDLFEFKDVIESLSRPIVRQRFLSVSSASSDRFADLPSDGIVAFNGQPESAAGTRLLILNLLQAKLIDSPIFSLWLDANPESNEGGELTIGGLNPTRYMGVMIRHPVVTGNGGDRWAVGLKEVLLGETVVSCYRKNCSATLATGVNDLFGPREDVLRIMEALRSIGGGIRIERSSNNEDLYEIDCLQVVNLPPLRFVINDVPYQIQPVDYLRKKVDGVLFKSATCYVAILPNDSSKSWILGSNFLSNFYTVYDYNKKEIGIAARTGKSTQDFHYHS